MKTALLLILLTLGGTRKEAARRWPAPAKLELWTNVTTTKTVYFLRVLVLQKRFELVGYQCSWVWKEFSGPSWQAVMDASKDTRSECEEVKP